MSRFVLPDLGEGLEEAQLVQWMVNVGDTVALNQPLCQVETAKALVDIPSPYTGVVTGLHAQPGMAVPVGALLITIEEHATSHPASSQAVDEQSGPVLVGYGASAPAQTLKRRRREAQGIGDAQTPSAPLPPSNGHQQAVAVATPPAPSVAPSPDAHTARNVRATPLVRKMAHAHGIDLATILGTGPNGRVRLADLEAVTSHSPVGMPAPAGPDEERISTVGLRKAIAARMVRAAAIPQFTEYGLFDATALTTVRAHLKDEPGFAAHHLTFLPFFVAALVRAVRAYPILNSRWDEQNDAIVLLRRVHVGIATDTSRGLLVPVIRDAHTLTLDGIAARANTLIGRARDGRLDPAELTGSTITITNVGAAGPVETGAPLLNPPEVSIVGFGAIKPRPTVVGDQLQVRPGAWISISCDHRVIDGATAAQFMGALVRYLEQPERLLAPLPAQ